MAGRGGGSGCERFLLGRICGHVLGLCEVASQRGVLQDPSKD